MRLTEHARALLLTPNADAWAAVRLGVRVTTVQRWRRVLGWSAEPDECYGCGRAIYGRAHRSGRGVYHDARCAARAEARREAARRAREALTAQR